MAADCLFCRIVSGGIPAAMLHDDALCVAIADIAPKAPVHLLVLPKEHFSGAPEIGPEREALVGHLVKVAADLARQKGLEPGGYRIVINSGAHGGQTVFHLHVHLLGGRPLAEMG
jgi:diadenosine tetraphosphate (Ap4A) HIT family hydrolase